MKLERPQKWGHADKEIWDEINKVLNEKVTFDRENHYGQKQSEWIYYDGCSAPHAFMAANKIAAMLEEHAVFLVKLEAPDVLFFTNVITLFYSDGDFDDDDPHGEKLVWHVDYGAELPDPTIPRSFVREYRGSPIKVYKLELIEKMHDGGYGYWYVFRDSEGSEEIHVLGTPSVPGYEDQWHSWKQAEDSQYFDFAEAE